MKTISIILWSIIIAIFLIFMRFSFIPYIKRKYTLWIMARQIAKMAKKYPGEEGEKLKEVSEGIKQLSKDERFFNNQQ